MGVQEQGTARTSWLPGWRVLRSKLQFPGGTGRPQPRDVTRQRARAALWPGGDSWAAPLGPGPQLPPRGKWSHRRRPARSAHPPPAMALGRRGRGPASTIRGIRAEPSGLRGGTQAGAPGRSSLQPPRAHDARPARPQALGRGGSVPWTRAPGRRGEASELDRSEEPLRSGPPDRAPGRSQEPRQARSGLGLCVSGRWLRGEG